MSNESSNSSASRTRRNSGADANRDAPFAPRLLKRAEAIASHYRIVLTPEEKAGWIGCAVEMPNVFEGAKTVAACVKRTREALVFAVATMLEMGQHPPESSERTMQVNIRLTAEEKLRFTSLASQHGFKGLSDFMRAAAFAWSNPR